MPARRCEMPCGKIIYASRRAAHRAMGKTKNQFAYWSRDCRCYHTSSSRIEKALRRRAA